MFNLALCKTLYRSIFLFLFFVFKHFTLLVFIYRLVEQLSGFLHGICKYAAQGDTKIIKLKTRCEMGVWRVLV